MARLRSRSPPPVVVVVERSIARADLRIYYDLLFPWESYFRWLNYGGSGGGAFSKREFSFMDGNGVWTRHRYFASAEKLRQAIRHLPEHKFIRKFDVGAMSLANQHTRKHGAQVVQQKEFVLDIDLDGYDDVRSCCRGASAVCPGCWTLITIAIKTLDMILREDFAFRHILWVFSGRRGVHCWVCDASARTLSNEDRCAIVDHLDGLGAQAAATGDALHPTVWRAYRTCVQPYLHAFVAGQPPLVAADNPDRAVWAKILGDSGAGVGSAVFSGSEEIVTNAQTHAVVLRCVWPRLDANVSKQLGHLLKTPWAIHSNTGKVCVPIDPAACELFDPNAVPTVDQVCRELRTWDGVMPLAAAAAAAAAAEYEKTSLRPYVDFWNSAFLGPLLNE